MRSSRLIRGRYRYFIFDTFIPNAPLAAHVHDDALDARLFMKSHYVIDMACISPRKVEYLLYAATSARKDWLRI